MAPCFLPHSPRNTAQEGRTSQQIRSEEQAVGRIVLDQLVFQLIRCVIPAERKDPQAKKNVTRHKRRHIQELFESLYSKDQVCDIEDALKSKKNVFEALPLDNPPQILIMHF